MESSKSFCIFCGLVITVVGIGGGSAAAADGYVAGVVIILISIPLAGLCFASTLANRENVPEFTRGRPLMYLGGNNHNYNDG